MAHEVDEGDNLCRLDGNFLPAQLLASDDIWVGGIGGIQEDGCAIGIEAENLVDFQCTGWTCRRRHTSIPTLDVWPVSISCL
jgi:hypothetical protein